MISKLSTAEYVLHVLTKSSEHNLVIMVSCEEQLLALFLNWMSAKLNIHVFQIKINI